MNEHRALLTMNIAEHRNHRINMNMTLLQRIDKHSSSYKYSYVKITGEIKLDALFGLMFCRKLLGANLS